VSESDKQETTARHRYSYLQQLHERLILERDNRFERLSPGAFKAMIAYFEERQLRIGAEVAAEDDLVRNAKLRGQNELLQEMAEDMFVNLFPKPEKPKKSKEEDGDG